MKTLKARKFSLIDPDVKKEFDSNIKPHSE